MIRICRSSKNFDGSGFGSLYYVDYRDASKSLTWYVLVHSYVNDVVVCKVGCLKTKMWDVGKTAFSRILYLCRMQLGLQKMGVCKGV